jgi:hypothetical protein
MLDFSLLKFCGNAVGGDRVLLCYFCTELIWSLNIVDAKIPVATINQSKTT